MAGVYIRGMKTPEKCEDCRFWDGHNNGCRVVHMITLRRIHQKKPSWCPLVEVPDHGDLIDRDALSKSLDELCDRICQHSKAQREVMCSSCPLGDAFIVVEDDAPAIIEAEEEK